MNKIKFHKYQGTGNDFIITEDLRPPGKTQIQFLCDRKYGVGADGLISMSRDAVSSDFKMMYYNADGSESFCGNGSRCAVMYARSKSWIGDNCTFESNDGMHHARIQDTWVLLKMHDVKHIEERPEAFVMNTGSPHYLLYCDGLKNKNILEPAQAIRFGSEFKEEGINVNFLQEKMDGLHVRTYERGVEDETLSCGTGVTAAALAQHRKNGSKAGDFTQPIQTLGGKLEIRFHFENKLYSEIYLCGPAVYVFEGEVRIP